MARDTHYRRSRSESGIALVSTLLVLMLMSALMVGFFAVISSDQMSSGVNRDQTQVYAAAHAGLEKLTADLGALFTVNYSPSAAQVNALGNDPPALPGFQYVAPNGGDGYQITFIPDVNGNPAPESAGGSPITAGPYQGLVGLITPYTIDVIARGPGGGEVQMRRTMQTVSVPVFQFGIYSENDLSFFAGPPFNFGGRVHTNQNVYLLQNTGDTLTLEDRVTAVGEVVRTHLPNGLASSVSGHQGTVRMARAAGVYRNLAANEGSVNIVGAPAVVPPSLLTTDADGRLVMQLQPPNTANDTWFNTSVGAYSSYIRNGRTGARRLDLPIVSDGARPIDLIRRPDRFNPDIVQVARQRFYSLASLRILLSDTVADLMNLPGIDASRQPISLDNAANFRAEMTARGFPAWLPIATSNGSTTQGYRMNNGVSLLGGFIKIERQNRDGVWFDVTAEILGLGTAGRNLSRGVLNTPDNTPGASPGPICRIEPHANAVVRIQRIKDAPANGAFSTVSGYTTVRCGNGSTSDTDYWPNALYDAREGGARDAPASLGTTPYMGGAMHYVEFDVNNFRRWIAGAIGATGDDNTMDTTGYVVYFSDRRRNRGPGPDTVVGTGDDRETGEFGWEDFVNPASAMSVPNGVLNAGEDVNGNGTLQTYGNFPRLLAGMQAPFDATARLSTTAANPILRINPPVFFRRALKVVNAARGQLPANGSQGLTIASENPVYIEGNVNACSPSDLPGACSETGGPFGPVGNGHVSAAVIADSVTLLSTAWNDILSFTQPHASVNRNASTTWYRLGIIAGKSVNFPRPTSNTGNDHTDFGTDGGAHNFLRYLEDWNGQGLNYRGSIVSLYTSLQGVGTYKCCDVVYQPPSRGYRFDSEFLNPNLLPPRTPMFRDINTLTFRQILRPTN